MKTIGEVIREFRVKKHFSHSDLERETKIKKEFLVAIEKENWVKLPEYPVVQGFIKNIAEVLSLNKAQAIALLRRDYPPKSLKINPNPDLKEKFTWSPRLTFISGVIVVFLLIIGYLGFQYANFVKAPALTVESPKDGEVVQTERLRVVGKTTPDSTVRVNNQPAFVDESGNFLTEVEVFEGTTEVVIKAVSRSGKETVISRNIVPDLNQSK